MNQYNPTGKKLTYEQHMKLLNQFKEKQEEDKGKDKPWLCEKCQASGFKLAIDKRRWIRTCKKCGHTKTIE